MRYFKMKVNLGCGTDIKKGFINLDIIKSKGVDVVNNLEKANLPFSSNSMDYILCSHIFEHIHNFKALFLEVKRVLNGNGLLRITVPYLYNIVSENHIRFFKYNSFTYRKHRNSLEEKQLYEDMEMIGRYIYFDKKYFWNYAIELIVNSNYYITMLYEETFLRYLFPAYDIQFLLKKSKGS